MGSQTLKAYCLLLLSFLCQAGSVVFGKSAALSIERFDVEGVLFNPYYALSLCCLGLQAIFWPLTLKHFPLSYAYVFMSGIYPAIVAISYFVFREQVTQMNLFGSVVIMLGMSVFATGKEVDGGDA